MARDEETTEASVNQTEQAPAQNEQAQVAQAPTEQAPSEDAPANGENSATEAPKSEEQGTEPAKPEGPTAEEVAKALTDFQAVADGVVAGVDKGTGDLVEAAQAQVKSAYGELPTPAAKSAARKWLQDQMKTALSKDRDVAKARAFLTLEEQVKAAGGRSETIARPPVDPTEAHVARVAAMYLSTSLAQVPDGVGDDWVQKLQAKASSLKPQVEAYSAWLKAHDTWSALAEDKRGDEPKAPEVDAIVINAAKIARGRGIGTSARTPKAGASAKVASIGGGYTGPRRDVKAHIRAAFDGKPVGTFLKIAEIANATSEEYGDGHPSSGAVTASLNSAKFNVEGIEAATENGLHGARKVS